MDIRKDSEQLAETRIDSERLSGALGTISGVLGATTWNFLGLRAAFFGRARSNNLRLPGVLGVTFGRARSNKTHHSGDSGRLSGALGTTKCDFLVISGRLSGTLGMTKCDFLARSGGLSSALGTTKCDFRACSDRFSGALGVTKCDFRACWERLSGQESCLLWLWTKKANSNKNKKTLCGARECVHSCNCKYLVIHGEEHWILRLHFCSVGVVSWGLAGGWPDVFLSARTLLFGFLSLNTFGERRYMANGNVCTCGFMRILL